VDPKLQRAQRLLALADAAVERADEARRAIEELLAEIAVARGAPDGPIGTRLDAARLAAIELAVAGRSRDEVARHVRSTYGVADVEPLLDDVFGPRDGNGALPPPRP
jgi:hypothetical protein